MKLTTTQIDWINIALMLASAAAAWVLPFEVFLFSYAVLGPLHYLTEISWLHERQYFTTGRRDAIVLFFLGVLLFLVAVVLPQYFPPDAKASQAVKQSYYQQMNQAGATIIYLAFMAALAMATFRTLGSKVLFMLVAGVFLMALLKVQVWILFFIVFLPTLVHVFIFTAAFMLLGALKGRSLPGLLAFALLWSLGAFLLFYQPETASAISTEVKNRYILFVELNRQFARLFGQELANPESALGLAIMRFIAFAYTYHYLNWFSKTSIIKWHQVNWKRLAAIVVLWVVAVGLYWWNYFYGFIALYTLSFLHVFLEFPLNWRSFIDLGKEVRGITTHGWARVQPQVSKFAPAPR